MKREETIGFVVRTLNNLMMRNAMDVAEMQDQKGMPMMQCWIIGFLYENRDREIFQKDIERECHIARSTVTCVVKQMEKKGFITRVPVERDSRLKKLCLLEKGEQIHEEFLDKVDLIEDRMREGVTDEELKVFFKVATRIRDNLEKNGGKMKEEIPAAIIK